MNKVNRELKRTSRLNRVEVREVDDTPRVETTKDSITISVPRITETITQIEALKNNAEVLESAEPTTTTDTTPRSTRTGNTNIIRYVLSEEDRRDLEALQNTLSQRDDVIARRAQDQMNADNTDNEEAKAIYLENVRKSNEQLKKFDEIEEYIAANLNLPQDKLNLLKRDISSGLTAVLDFVDSQTTDSNTRTILAFNNIESTIRTEIDDGVLIDAIESIDPDGTHYTEDLTSLSTEDLRSVGIRVSEDVRSDNSIPESYDLDRINEIYDNSAPVVGNDDPLREDLRRLALLEYERRIREDDTTIDDLNIIRNQVDPQELKLGRDINGQFIPYVFSDTDIYRQQLLQSIITTRVEEGIPIK